MNRIYCFSGTGNTLNTARRFAAELPDAKIEMIARLDRSETIVPDGDTFGIFFPVYCFGIPSIVVRFLRRLRKNTDGSQPYIYLVNVSGGMSGASQVIASDELKAHGIRLDAAFHIVMPSNYIPLSAPPEKEKMEQIFKRADKMMLKALDSVKKHVSNPPLRIPIVDGIETLIARKADDTLKNADRWFWTDEKCTGCGKCAAVCPNSNITLDSNGKPCWHHFCEQCMACLQWCPEEAIQFRKITLKRKRYHHPSIHYEDIARSV